MCRLLVTLFRLIFFAVNEIRSILRRNHISLASSFFCSCFKIFNLLVLISFSENSFFFFFFFFACAIFDANSMLL